MHGVKGGGGGTMAMGMTGVSGDEVSMAMCMCVWGFPHLFTYTAQFW